MAGAAMDGYSFAEGLNELPHRRTAVYLRELFSFPASSGELTPKEIRREKGIYLTRKKNERMEYPSRLVHNHWMTNEGYSIDRFTLINIKS